MSPTRRFGGPSTPPSPVWFPSRRRKPGSIRVSNSSADAVHDVTRSRCANFSSPWRASPTKAEPRTGVPAQLSTGITEPHSDRDHRRESADFKPEPAGT